LKHCVKDGAREERLIEVNASRKSSSESQWASQPEIGCCRE